MLNSIICHLEPIDFYFQRGYAAIGSYYNRIPESSEEKEVQRKKEVSDLISKYTTKKKLPENPSVKSSLDNFNGDYSPTSRYGSYRDSLYGSLGRRRSGVFDNFPDTSTSKLGQRDYGTINPPKSYLGSSQSSTNLYQSPSASSSHVDLPSRLSNSVRQQKTLSFHGVAGATTSSHLKLAGHNPLLQSSFQSPTTDWNWSSVNASRTNLSPYSKYADPLTSPLKGLGFWQNSSSTTQLVIKGPILINEGRLQMYF